MYLSKERIVTIMAKSKFISSFQHHIPRRITNLLILRGVEWVHGLFLFPLVLGKM